MNLKNLGLSVAIASIIATSPAYAKTQMEMLEEQCKKESMSFAAGDVTAIHAMMNDMGEWKLKGLQKQSLNRLDMVTRPDDAPLECLYRINQLIQAFSAVGTAGPGFQWIPIVQKIVMDFIENLACELIDGAWNKSMSAISGLGAVGSGINFGWGGVNWAFEGINTSSCYNFSKGGSGGQWSLPGVSIGCDPSPNFGGSVGVRPSSSGFVQSTRAVPGSSFSTHQSHQVPSAPALPPIVIPSPSSTPNTSQPPAVAPAPSKAGSPASPY